jgi:hypothetical protein
MHSGRIDAREMGRKGCRSRKSKRVPFEELAEREAGQGGRGSNRHLGTNTRWSTAAKRGSR